MKRPARLAVFLAATLLLSSPGCFADGVLWKTLNDAGQAAKKRGSYSDADRQFQASLKEAEAFGEKDDRLRETMRQLAEVKELRGKLAEAAELWAKVLALDEKVRGASSAEVGEDLTYYASVQRKLGKLNDAEHSATRAVSVLEKKSDQTAHLLDALKALGVVYQSAGKYTEAEATFKKALSIAEKTGAKTGGAFTAPQLELLAALYRDQGRLTDAEPLYKQSLAERETRNGIDDYHTVHSELVLAKLYIRLNRFEEAEKLLKKGIASLEKDPQDNDEYADLVAAQALIFQQKDKPAEALKLFDKAVQVQEDALGENHPKVGELLRVQSLALMDADKYIAAEAAARRSRDIAEKVYGKGAVEVMRPLIALAEIYLQQGKYAESENCYKRALRGVVEAFGPRDPDVPYCLNNLGMLYWSQGQNDEAFKVVKAALDQRESTLGPTHVLVATNLYHLGRVLVSQQKFSEAEKELKRALEIMEMHEGDPLTARILNELAMLYSSSQKPADAERYYRRLLKLDEITGGANSGEVASDLECLAQVLIVQGKTDDAVSMQNRAKDIKKKLPGYNAETSSLPADTTPVPANFNKPVRDKWALVIGISNFKDTSLNLKYAAKDATDFRNYLVNEANFAPDHVKTLIDSQATRQNIVENLGDKWLGKVSSCDDLVVIYLSTHGSNAVAELANANFVVPHDANLGNMVLSGIPMKYLTLGIKDLVQCNRIVLVADVCHGGAMGDNNNAPGRNEQLASVSGEGKGLVRPNAFVSDNVQVGAGELIIASSEADQISWESKSYPNGVFTRKLIDGLRQKGAETSVKDAYQYMKSRVEEEVLRDRAEVQTPVFIASMWKGNEVILGVKPSQPGPVPGTVANDVAPVEVSSSRSVSGAKGASGNQPPNMVKTRKAK